MYSYSADGLNDPNLYSEPVKDEFFSARDTKGMAPLLAADFYPNVLINRASYSEGDATGKNGQPFHYELLNLEIIDVQTNRKADLSLSVNSKIDRLRIDELVYLLGLTDANGNPGLRLEHVDYNGRQWVAETTTPGNMIDVVLDGFYQDKKGYVRCKCLGFFKNRRSCREIMCQISDDQLTDAKNCTLCCITSPRGVPIKIVEQQTPPPFAAKPTFAQGQTGFAPAPQQPRGPAPVPQTGAGFMAPPPPPGSPFPQAGQFQDPAARAVSNLEKWKNPPPYVDENGVEHPDIPF